MIARTAVLASCLLAAGVPVSVSAQSMSGPPPANATTLGDAYRAIARAQATMPNAQGTAQAAALYAIAAAKYNAGDIAGANREATLASGLAQIASPIAIPLLSSTIDTARTALPRSLVPGLQSLNVRGAFLPALPMLPAPAPNAPTAAYASMNPCDSLGRTALADACRKALVP